jgi:hypothetical protein
VTFKLPNIDRSWENAHDMVLDAQLGFVQIEENQLSRIASSKRFDLVTRFECILAIAKMYQVNIDKLSELVEDIEFSNMKSSYFDVCHYILNPNFYSLSQLYNQISDKNVVKSVMFTRTLVLFLLPLHRIIFEVVINRLMVEIKHKTIRAALKDCCESLESFASADVLMGSNVREWNFGV